MRLVPLYIIEMKIPVLLEGYACKLQKAETCAKKVNWDCLLILSPYKS